ncbi:MAG: hypothetical protein CVU46_01975 [Chloroflexi bacterium HGW-Chloroflexi-8]|nr:MAG: hypothetical protein CVU46_01975 [Chloroflexi bacterium HGW-Chloroflexi-8]
MLTIAQRSLLIILLLLTAINLAGYITAPSSCCMVQENPGLVGDADCLVCTLQVGVWLRQLVVANSNTFISKAITDNQLIAVGHLFNFNHPPIA